MKPKDVRLQELAKSYAPISMPTVEDLNGEQLQALAGYLLRH